MRIDRPSLFHWLMILAVVAMSASCAGADVKPGPRSDIRDCPPGFVLVCESRQEPSKGGAEEEIPEYEYCRCEQAY